MAIVSSETITSSNNQSTSAGTLRCHDNDMNDDDQEMESVCGLCRNQPCDKRKNALPATAPVLRCSGYLSSLDGPLIRCPNQRLMHEICLKKTTVMNQPCNKWTCPDCSHTDSNLLHPERCPSCESEYHVVQAVQQLCAVAIEISENAKDTSLSSDMNRSW